MTNDSVVAFSLLISILLNTRQYKNSTMETQLQRQNVKTALFCFLHSFHISNITTESNSQQWRPIAVNLPLLVASPSGHPSHPALCGVP